MAGEFNITDAESNLIVEFTGGKTYSVNKDGGVTEISTIQEEIDSVESAEDANIKIKLSISGTKVITPPIPSGFRYQEGI